MAKHLLGTAGGEFGYEGHTQIGGWLAYPGGGYEKMIDTMAAAGGIGVYPEHSSKVVNAGMTAYGIRNVTGTTSLRHTGHIRNEITQSIIYTKLILHTMIGVKTMTS